MKGKFIQITDEQEEFIEDQSKRFNLSGFVRTKLNEYIKLKEELKNEKEI